MQAFPEELAPAFAAFCQHMSIKFRGRWIEPPPVQLTMEGL